MRTTIAITGILLSIAGYTAFFRNTSCRACSDDELANVTGGIFTECDGDTPCEVYCHPTAIPDLFYFEYNNGSQACGSPSFDNCSHGVRTDCQRRYFDDAQCLHWNDWDDIAVYRAACSGRTLGWVPYPNP